MQDLELLAAFEQISAQLAFFRNQAVEARNKAIRLQSELVDYQTLLTALLVKQRARKIEVTPDLVEKMGKCNGMRMVKQWKGGILSLELKEKRQDD